MGHDPHGRRHATPAWLDIATGAGASRRGRKLVVQMLQTYQRGGQPAFVETLDAVAVGQAAKLSLPPVMIYGDDVPSRGHRGRRRLSVPGGQRGGAARRAGRGGQGHADRFPDHVPASRRLRRDGLVAYPEDLGVDPTLADRSLLAARSIGDLVTWSQAACTSRPPSSGTGRDRDCERAAPRVSPDLRPRALGPCVLGCLAAGALRAEAELTPKPGLVDRRGSGAHDDMDLAMLLRSAAVLQPWFATLARTAARAPGMPGAAPRLRRDLGRMGRQAEAEMLAATGASIPTAARYTAWGSWSPARRTPTRSRPPRSRGPRASWPGGPISPFARPALHGDLVRDQHPGVGAAVHAATGFPVTLRTALPALRASRRRGAGEQAARLDALLAVMAVLDDTCVLYRGGRRDSS